MADANVAKAILYDNSLCIVGGLKRLEERFMLLQSDQQMLLKITHCSVNGNLLHDFGATNKKVRSSAFILVQTMIAVSLLKVKKMYCA